MMAEAKKYREIMLPWVEFARRHDAEVEAPQPDYNYSDSNFVVSKENEFEIYFQWSGVPYSGPVSYSGKEKNTTNDRRHETNSTHFYFPVYSSEGIEFQVRQKNWMTAIALLFTSGKAKIGDDKLDKKYFFTSNKENLFDIYAIMKEFDSGFDGTAFVLKAEGEEIGVEKRIHIYVVDLLREEEGVERFFKLGRALQKQANSLIGY